jgi:hypothetical protein
MNDVLAGLLKTVAPGLATIVAGPLGGMAVKAIAEKLGVEDTVEAVASAIQADPQAAQKLAEIDIKQFELHNANTDSARKMNAEIQESANASWLAKNTAYALDIGIVSATIFLAWFAFMKGVPDANKELVYMALGSLITMSGTILNFHRGSSQGSKDKGADIQKLKDAK